MLSRDEQEKGSQDFTRRVVVLLKADSQKLKAEVKLLCVE
jgi:hypothetical protein